MTSRVRSSASSSSVSPSADSDVLATRRRGLAIDKHQLDSELEKDAAYVQEVGDECALAGSKRDEMRLVRDEVLAELDVRFRGDAERSGTKVTEKSLQSQIDLSPEAQSVRRRYLQACEYADRLDVLARAYHIRAADIRALGELYKSGYYSINNRVRAREDEADRAEKAGAANSRNYGRGV